MRFRSKKRAEQWKLYEKEKKKWRKERIEIDGYHRCEWVGDGERCRHKADRNPHHRFGRDGKYLYDSRFFMSTCPIHHRLIHASPATAYAMGYLILRSLKKVVDSDEKEK